MGTETMTREILRDSVVKFRVWTVALWKRLLRLSSPAPKRLRLFESLPLGEHRFVAVVEFDTARFLVGGTPSSLVLLCRLGDAEEPAEGKQQDSLPWKALTTSARIRPVEKC